MTDLITRRAKKGLSDQNIDIEGPLDFLGEISFSVTDNQNVQINANKFQEVILLGFAMPSLACNDI